MEKYDKDNMFCAMPAWNMFDKWRKSSKSQLAIKDRKKLDLVCEQLMLLFKSIAKQVGEDAFNAMLEESKKYDFLIAPKEAKVGEKVTGTFQDVINESVIREVLASNECECYLCTKEKDYTKCGWFALNSLLNPPPKNCHECPYKKNILGD